uniref:Uncharacterized protein n=1 Tax=Anguilla anguilla TaxID=7936 RepID=A0A0E9RHD8_ANGAN
MWSGFPFFISTSSSFNVQYLIKLNSFPVSFQCIPLSVITADLHIHSLPHTRSHSFTEVPVTTQNPG